MSQSEFDALVQQVCSIEVVDPTVPLVDLGVDSLGHLALVMAVEDHYGVEIDPEALGSAELASPAGLRRHVESLVSA